MRRTRDPLEEAAIRASSGSLRKAMRRISERFALVAEIWPPYQDCLMRMVERIVTDAAEEGFGQGFRAGAQAGVAAALPQGHDEYIRVASPRQGYQIEIDGLNPFTVRPQQYLIAENEQ